MEKRNPKLIETLLNLPNIFEQYKVTAQQRFDEIERAIEDARYIDMTNGDGHRVKVAKILPEMKKDIDRIKSVIVDIPDIKNSTEFLRDFAKVHFIFKRYKLYYGLVVIIGFVGGYSVKGLLLAFIKEILK